MYLEDGLVVFLEESGRHTNQLKQDIKTSAN